METCAKALTFRRTMLVLVLLVLAPSAMAQKPKRDGYLKNVELCNSLDRKALEARIMGCTALIAAGDRKATALAIAYNNRGNAYAATGEYNRAIQDFDQSIKLDPAYAKPFNNRGVAYARKGEIDLAIEAYGDAIKLKPNYGEAFANRAEAYVKQHRYDRAASDYDEAIRLAPNLDAVLAGRCWTRAILGALQTALEDCDKALKAGATAVTYDSRGLIRLKMSDFGAAIDDYSAALQLDPKLATALYGRGLAKLKQGDKAGGENDVEAARAIQADIADEFARYGVRI
jgi:tetratricopeptide (TPR) repeat protein